MVLGGEDYIKSDNIDSHQHHTSVTAVGSETDAQYLEMLKMLSVNQDNGMFTPPFFFTSLYILHFIAYFSFLLLS